MEFNNENLNDLAFQYKDLIENRFDKVKKISEDIKQAETLLASAFLKEYSKKYAIHGIPYIFSWEKGEKSLYKRIYVDDTYGHIKPPHRKRNRQ